MTTKNTQMKDVSIFHGITEFEALNGEQYKLNHNERTVWQLKDGDWWQVGYMPLRAGKSPAAIWKFITGQNNI